MRQGSDREMAAVTFNQKEQRCLERAMKTLHLEHCYQLKLLDLDHRVIKVNYRRLKDKVTRIKSHLTADEIHSLRKCDNENKMKFAQSSINLTGKLKISAAAKRLKCFPTEKFKRTVSADSRLVTLGGQGSPVPLSANIRSNSVTGVFTNAPILNKTQRKELSDLGLIATDVSKSRTSVLVDGDGALYTGNQQNVIRTHSSARPSVIANHETSKPSASRPDTGSPGNAAPHSHSPFSSHSAAEKDAARLLTELFPAQKDVKSFPCDESIDSNFGDDLFEERRRELLEDELSKAAELEVRKNEFLKRVGNYFQETSLKFTPKDVFQKRERKQSLSRDSPPEAAVDAGRLLNRRLRVEFDDTPTYLPEEEYRNRLLNLWTDMNKCRYLRVPEGIIDLSGIQTLATEQVRLFDSLRRPGHKTFAASAEV